MERIQFSIVLHLRLSRHNSQTSAFNPLHSHGHSLTPLEAKSASLPPPSYSAKEATSAVGGLFFLIESQSNTTRLPLHLSCPHEPHCVEGIIVAAASKDNTLRPWKVHTIVRLGYYWIILELRFMIIIFHKDSA
ncbi:hypothetical protein CMV_021937 [Castanea mollissima]|uniref:Uncharacterized protein n=1 Tax=Castanea mollissima TaxID=60419 RepID=A0A8J4VEQ2_9ROSI|nr:hypothetical protein CMV_021937 [Castanea mollissima]